MLTLSRRPGEYIQIGNDIRVRVVAISGNQVKLVIDAPREMTILRAELINDPEQPSSDTLGSRF